MKAVRSIIFIAIMLQWITPAAAQFQTGMNEKGEGYYVNPIFAGDCPDPSLLRDGDDYYMVHSSFDYYPGLLVWTEDFLADPAEYKKEVWK